MQNKPSKPWYKVWWIWVIIAVAFIMILTVLGGGSDSDSSSSSSSDSKTSSSASSKIEESNPLDKTYKAGQTVDYKGYKIKVNKVNYSAGDDIDTPDKGKQYVIVNVTITNDTDEKQDYNPYDFQLSEDGNSTDFDDYLSDGEYSNNDLNSGKLDTGSSVTGNLISQASTNVKKLQLRYQPSFFDDKTLNIDLK